MKKRTFLAVAGAVVVSFALSTLPSSATPTPSPHSTTNPYGTGAIDPAGPNDAVLTLHNGTKKRSLTYKALLEMHSSVITIYEPFVKKTQTFTVIPLSLLFNQVGIKGSDTVVTTALNAYGYTNKAVNFIRAQGYLAIKRGGLPIPYDEGGPIRLIYPKLSSWSKLLDPWNWSLSDISVKH